MELHGPALRRRSTTCRDIRSASAIHAGANSSADPGADAHPDGLARRDDTAADPDAVAGPNANTLSCTDTDVNAGRPDH